MSESKKKIIFVITKGNFGGAQRYVFDLASHLSTERFDVAVAVGEGAALKEKLERLGVRVISLARLVRDVSPLSDIKAFVELFLLFRRERPDIVHLNSSKAGGLGSFAFRCFQFLNFLTAKSYKLKAVFTVHGFAFYESRPFPARVAIMCLSWLTVLLSHAVIVLNNHDRAAMRAWPFVGRKIRKIKLGIENGPAFGNQEALLKLEAAGMARSAGPLLGAIAELHTNKGLSYLIGALTLLPATVSLCIIGNGEEKENLKLLARERSVASRVFFAGFLDGASRYLSAFDLFVLPSLKEGTPYVLLEAGSQGIPVVASDIGGIGEVIVDRQTGLLVPPKNPALLAESIHSALAHPEEMRRESEALRRKIATEFSLDRMLQETLTVYAGTIRP